MTVNSQNGLGQLLNAQRAAFMPHQPHGHGPHRCGPFPTRPGMQLGNLMGALGKFFEALEKLINSVEQNQGHNHTPGSGVHNFTPSVEGTQVHNFTPGVGDGPFQDIWEGGCIPKPTPKPIAGEARIWGDPHFVGADGGKYDIQGRPGGMYNLLSDKGFQMNGRFDAWGKKGATVVGEVGIVAGGNRIAVEKDGDVKINGRNLRDGQCVTLCDGTKVTKMGKTVKIESAEWDVKIKSVDSRNGNYLNIDVSTDNAIADGVKPHGLLGQTFDGDGKARNGDKGSGAQGGGAIETVGGSFTEAGDKTTVGSYEVGGMHAVGDSLFSRYGPGATGQPFDPNSDPVLNVARTAFGVLTVSMLQAQFTPMHMNNGGQASWVSSRPQTAW